MSTLERTSELRPSRPLVFLAVGIFNTLADYLFYTILTRIFLSDPDQIGLAGLISGTFALLCAFLTHSLITWRGSDIKRSTLLRFFAFTGFGMWIIRPVLLSQFIKLDGLYSWLYTISKSIGLPFDQAFTTNTGAFGLMVLIVLIYNYVVYDRYVFRIQDKSTIRT